jgi:cell division protein FtsB
MTESNENNSKLPIPAEAEGRPGSTSLKAALASRGRRLVRHALVFITLIIIVDAIAGEKGLLALLEARRDYSALERSLVRARTENAELREMARRLREEPRAIEEQARRELGLIKPGEMLFIVKDIEKKQKP